MILRTSIKTHCFKHKNLKLLNELYNYVEEVRMENISIDVNVHLILAPFRAYMTFTYIIYIIYTNILIICLYIHIHVYIYIHI